MLSLTKKTEYALIACCHLARRPDQVVSARDIARRYACRLPLLMNVMKALNRAGVLHSVRGARGGYGLASSAGELSLARLVEAVEGPVRLVRCAPPAESEGAGCEMVCGCPIRSPVLKLHEELRGFMERVTVENVAFDECYAEAAGTQPTLRVLAT